jgi:AcrR family transcriptional regulator
MTTTKARQRRKEDRPGEILQAAVEEFAEYGFGAAKIENIAKRCGVAKGTVYLYYATKEDLFEALVRDRIKPFIGQVDAMVSMWPGSSSDLLRKLVGMFYSEMIEDDERRMVLRILISEGGRFEHLAKFYYDEVLSGARRLLSQVIQNGIASGEFRDTPIAKEPRVIVGPAIFAAVWKMTFDKAEKLKTKQWMEAHIDLVVHGLKKS